MSHLGRRKVLQCLLAVRQLLNSLEPYYILNNLYITEYCVWIQKARYMDVCVCVCVCTSFCFIPIAFSFSLPLPLSVQC